MSEEKGKKTPEGVNAKGLNALFNAGASFGDTTSRRILTVPIEKVVSKAQVRKHFEDIEELAASLLAEGQLSPVIVSPMNADGVYVIQKGERRWRALSHAGIKTIDIDIAGEYKSVVDGVASELIENIQRDSLKPIEIADALQKFIEEGWGQKDIAKRIGKTPKYISTHLALLNLPGCVRELADKNITHDTDTLNNLRLTFSIDEEPCRALCETAIKNGSVSRADSRSLLNKVKTAAKTSTGPDNVGVEMPAAEEKKQADWESAEGRAVVAVNVIREKSVVQGSLFLERIAKDLGKAWVLIEGELGVGRPELVNVDALEIVGIIKR